jgi:hypothetical protein
MLCGLDKRTEVAIQICDKTKVWLNVFFHGLLTVSALGLYSISLCQGITNQLSQHLGFNMAFISGLASPVILPTHHYCGSGLGYSGLGGPMKTSNPLGTNCLNQHCFHVIGQCIVLWNPHRKYIGFEKSPQLLF